MELALVENLQRERFEPLETATAYQGLLDSFGFTKEQLAEGWETVVTNTLRLTRLPAIRALILEGELTEGHAREPASSGGRRANDGLPSA